MTSTWSPRRSGLITLLDVSGNDSPLDRGECVLATVIGSPRTFDGRAEILSSCMTGTASSPSQRRPSWAWRRQCGLAMGDQIRPPRSRRPPTSSPVTNTSRVESGTAQRFEMHGRRACGFDSSMPSRRRPKAAVRNLIASPVISMNGLIRLPSTNHRPSRVLTRVGWARPLIGARGASRQAGQASRLHVVRDFDAIGRHPRHHVADRPVLLVVPDGEVHR